MQIRRETDYAIRCVYYLKNKLNEITAIDEIASKMHIPRTFLAKILQKLSKAKIVKSHRGAKGGFSLAKKPEDISIFDVIKIFEGSGCAALNACAVEKKRCSLSNKCSIHPIWFELREETEKRLKSIKFSQIK